MFSDYCELFKSNILPNERNDNTDDDNTLKL